MARPHFLYSKADRNLWARLPMHLLPPFLRILLTSVLLVLSAASGHAQNDEAIRAEKAMIAAVEHVQQKTRADIDDATLKLQELRRQIDEASGDDAQLAEFKAHVDDLARTLAKSVGELDARYQLVSKRLEEIGPPPPAGTEEDPEITEDRKRLQEEKLKIAGILSDGEVIHSDAEELSDHVTDLRRELFTATLFRRTAINSDLIEDTIAAVQDEAAELTGALAATFDHVWEQKRRGLVIAFLVSGLVALAMNFLIHRFFPPLIYRDPAERSPSYFRRLSVAFFSATMTTLAAAVISGTALGLLFSFDVLRDDVFDIVAAVTWAVVGVYFVYKLSRGIFSPRKPQWRLIDVTDEAARQLTGFGVTLGAINGFAYVIEQMNIALDAPIVVTAADGLITSIATGIVLILLGLIRPMNATTGPTTMRHKVLPALFLVIGIAIILTALFGYVGLARFASSQIVVTGAIVVTMYIGFLAGHAISRHHAFADSAAGSRLRTRGVTDARLEQIGLVTGLVIYAVVLFVGIPLIMLTWGFRAADIWSIFIRLSTEIHVGNISISLFGILAGLAVFALVLLVTRWFQRWLDTNVMARSQVDIGVRNSVNTTLGYAGIVIAGVIGISAAGINLSSFALVAGALSLGIGFGLQTIVQNFVSGLILLAERPFKVGDWIVNGPVEGYVRRISVRATEIETFQNQSIIVPNSQLINAAVGNWTLHNKLARAEIAVHVSYDSDPRRVMEILLEIARGHPKVLTMPEPGVGFQRFGEFAMEFELRFYLSDIYDGGAVRNEMRIQIIERFREEGIEIPLPQRTLNVRFLDDNDELANALAEEGVPDDVAQRILSRAEKRRQFAAARAKGKPLIDDQDASAAQEMLQVEHEEDKR